MSRHPTVRWAQTAEKLFITIDLPDAENVKLKLEPEGKFSFSAISGAEKIPFEVDIDLYDNVDINGSFKTLRNGQAFERIKESKASVGMRNIRYLIEKAEKKGWSRLLKQEGKPPVFVKVDWDKWIDENEENEKKIENDINLDELEFSNLVGASEVLDVGKGMDDGEDMDAVDVFGEDDENDDDINNKGDDKVGEKPDRAPLAEAVNEPGSTSSKPDAKA